MGVVLSNLRTHTRLVSLGHDDGGVEHARHSAHKSSVDPPSLDISRRLCGSLKNALVGYTHKRHDTHIRIRGAEGGRKR